MGGGGGGGGGGAKTKIKELLPLKVYPFTLIDLSVLFEQMLLFFLFVYSHGTNVQ